MPLDIPLLCPPLCDFVPRSLPSPPSLPFPCQRDKSFDLLPTFEVAAQQAGGPTGPPDKCRAARRPSPPLYITRGDSQCIGEMWEQSVVIGGTFIVLCPCGRKPLPPPSLPVQPRPLMEAYLPLSLQVR